MRKLILNLAISLDGRIVDENYKYDWIEGDGNTANDTKNQMDFPKFIDSCDTMIFGKKAYDDITKEALDEFDNKRIFVLTHSKDKPDRANVSFINTDIVAFTQELMNKPGKNIWLFGGAGVCDPFIKAQIIDTYIVGIIPIIVGKGTLLFNDDNPRIKLKLVDQSTTEGIVILTYENR